MKSVFDIKVKLIRVKINKNNNNPTITELIKVIFRIKLNPINTITIM
jgi:ribosomal protein L23